MNTPQLLLPHLNLRGGSFSSTYSPLKQNRPDTYKEYSASRRLKKANNLLKQVGNAYFKRKDFIQHEPLKRWADTGLAISLITTLDAVAGAETLEIKKSTKGGTKAPVQVLSIIPEGDKNVRVSYYIPEGRKDDFLNKIQSYSEKQQLDESNPKAKLLTESKNFKLLKLKDAWLGEGVFPYNLKDTGQWQVWLRHGEFSKAQHVCKDLKLVISKHSVKFEECEVCLISGSLSKLSKFQDLTLAVIGFAKQPLSADFFDSMKAYEQVEWLDSFIPNISFAEAEKPVVSILDTGIMEEHKILKGSFPPKSFQAFNNAWGNDDKHGHGTQMAGIALYGDLIKYLTSTSTLVLTHGLESLKILPEPHHLQTELYGVITEQTLLKAKGDAPTRKRVLCIAVSTPPFTDHGLPTEWSSTIDRICMGVGADKSLSNDEKILTVVSSGNVQYPWHPGEYPQRNFIEAIEDPGMSWNALTIGAYTNKIFIDDPTLSKDWLAVAPVGGLSPFSRTSLKWVNYTSPIKPDLVLEGGNYISDGKKFIVWHADLSSLTTGLKDPLTTIRASSAATAEAAHMAATLTSLYPKYWPETIRALMINSASWTEAMLGGKKFKDLLQDDKIQLLRKYGYGVPSLEEASHSSKNQVNLVIEGEFQPFKKNGSFNQLSMHKLPWPQKFLEDNSNKSLRVKISLSYFIEPNPSVKTVLPRSYPSHGLDFNIQRALEKDDTFFQRVNRIEREKNPEYTNVGSDSWDFGVNSRNRGTIVLDSFKTNAINLLTQRHIAIIPEGGWWQTRRKAKRATSKVRYSIVVNINCLEDIDLYSDIKTEVDILNDVKNPVALEIVT